jgi:hypothetical protein
MRRLNTGQLCLALLLCSLIIPIPAAQADDGARMAITPLLGWRTGGRFEAVDGDRRASVQNDATLALALNLVQSPGRLYELYYGRQQSPLKDSELELKVEYLHVGGLVTWPRQGYASFVSGGLGATRFALTKGGDSDVRPSVSLGAGILVPLGARLAFRLEARGHVTLTDGDSGLACISGPQGAACQLAYQGNSFIQYEALAGLSLRF